VLILITYDVNTQTKAGETRLHKVAKKCQNYGQRVQNSVFECLIDPAQFTLLKHELSELIDLETDSLRFYSLGNHWRNKVEHIGAKKSLDLEGPLIA
jgi:CRISPR-associated protein Cas2